MKPSTELSHLLGCLEGVRRSGFGYVARCPAHDDRTASLSLADGREGVVMKCHAGCDSEAVTAALGLTMADLFPPKEQGAPARPPKPEEKPRQVAQYDYHDESGAVLFRVVRFAYPDGRKTFRQERFEGGRYRSGMTGADGEPVRRVLFRLPRIREAAGAGRVVFVVEGEKDVRTLERLGLTATTNPGGAGKWGDEYAESLRGAARVVVLPDNDEAGRKHAAAVIRSCLTTGVPVRLVELPGLRKRGDVTDWVEAGGTADDLRHLVGAAPDATVNDAEVLLAVDAGIHSAQYREGAEQKEKAGRNWSDRPDPANLLQAFRTAAELAKDPPEETTWLVPGLLPRGAFVQLTGAAKGGGKTTFLLHALGAVLTGGEFLGEPTERCPVVYLTEQSRETFENEYLRRVGLAGCEDLHVLYGYLTTPYAWEDVMHIAVEKARDVGAGIICVDTFAYFGRVSDEQDAAIMGAAVRPLQDAAASGLTVVAVHHDRKGGGDPWDSGRGSSAFAGAVDVLVNLRRSQGGGRDTLRELRAEGRYGGLHSSVMIELTEAGYVACGTSQDVARQEVKQTLAHLLPLSAADAMTMAEIVEAVKEQGLGGRATVQRALDALTRERRVATLGEGKKGDPCRYYLHGLVAPEMLSAQPPLYSGQNEYGDVTGVAANRREMLSAQGGGGLGRKHSKPFALMSVASGDGGAGAARSGPKERGHAYEMEDSYEDF